MPGLGLDRNQPTTFVQHREVEVPRHVPFGFRPHMPKTGALLPQKDFFLGTTPWPCFLSTGFSCWRDLTTPLRVGWETKSLKVAGSDLRTRWSRCWKNTLSATVPGGRTLRPCKPCGAGMNDYTAVVADVAQFYEEVSQDEIVKTLKWDTRRARQFDAQVVTVFRLRGFAST